MEADGERIRGVLVSRFGYQDGCDVYADALLWAVDRWGTIADLDNPAGYLWRVARSNHRQYRRWLLPPRFPLAVGAEQEVPGDRDLLLSLGVLSAPERIAVVMIHAYGATYQEAADALGVPVSSVNNYVHRALRRLRAALGVDGDPVRVSEVAVVDA